MEKSRFLSFPISRKRSVRLNRRGFFSAHCISAVVGPNGIGKSNVINDMLFVFGKRVKQKSMHGAIVTKESMARTSICASVKDKSQQRPASDIAISGLGWISVEPYGLEMGENEHVDYKGGELHLDVHLPRPVEVFVRPPLPVGPTSAEWYQYRELTESEEELRPKWYY
ncbi:putative nitric oxide synthase [Platanthera guangdongensis]|uniref:Nitric oxide synthase n=1 Tax=Platanthera guangdongensis TaxID=2320717 RepID=A0ABR2N325_9ASPA